MSDHCWLRIECLKQDREKLINLLGEEPDEINYDDDCPTDALIFDAANFALFDARAAASNSNIPWIGSNSRGFEYGATIFVCDGREELSTDCNENGHPVAVIRNDLTLDKEDAEYLRRYFALEAKVKKMLFFL